MKYDILTHYNLKIIKSDTHIYIYINVQIWSLDYFMMMGNE